MKTADIERNKRETGSESRKPGLRSGNRVVLQVEDGFLTKIDEDLPFTRHVVSAVEKIDLVEDFKGTVPVRTEEVVVGDPESQVIVGAIKIVETVSM